MVDICKGKKQLFKIIFKKIFLLSLILGIFLIMHNFYKTHIHFYISKRGEFGINECFIILIIILIGIIFQRVVEGFLSWYKDKIKIKVISFFDKEFISFFQYTLKLLIWSFVFFGILSVIEVRLTYLVNILTISFVILILVVKDNILNAAAGCMIVIDSPFLVGDRIEIFSGEIVEVLEVGIRRSKFLSKKKAVINIPNVLLNKIKIVNHSSYKSC